MKKENAWIRVEDVCHEFYRKNENGEVVETNYALSHLDLKVQRGQFISIIGRNGCGKSTLAKLLNALLVPTSGTVWIGNLSSSKEEEQYRIRQTAGMVFQNPDNQLVSPVVEEDVGFGPENLGVPKEEIWLRVEHALRSVDMWEYRKFSPNQLSGGQKQRVAIAGILAMKPKCIIADEPTAMLDPAGRREIIDILHELNQKEGVTIILITHHMEETVNSDYIYCMEEGKIAIEGTPKEIFSMEEKLESMGMELPVVTKLAFELRKQGLPLKPGILSLEELQSCLVSLKQSHAPILDRIITNGNIFEAGGSTITNRNILETDRSTITDKYIDENKNSIIKLDHISYQYHKNSKDTTYALDDVSMNVYEGEFLGIIGQTGSGKSTLMQHLNGLLKPKQGNIYYDGKHIYDKSFALPQLRFDVGLVFQYPEYQLFEDTVIEDVMFGPKNKKLSPSEARERAIWALEQVQLSKQCWDKSPFVLSGGQKRKAAIAGVLALKPRVLVVDEPTAGLDPQGRKQILHLLKKLQCEYGMTIVMVSHNMDDVAEYADRMIALGKGKIILEGSAKQVFAQMDTLQKNGLDVPQFTKVWKKLGESLC